jgi:YHS domain-containing protein
MSVQASVLQERNTEALSGVLCCTFCCFSFAPLVSTILPIMSTTRLSGLRRTARSVGLALLLGLAGSLLVAPAAVAQEAGTEPATAAADSTLKQVEARFICMINDKVHDSEQIAVPVGNNTYYGCCQMCVEKLNENPDSRTAVDPVSGNRVDKSEAVLGAAPDGTVYYFESVANLRAFDLNSADDGA